MQRTGRLAMVVAAALTTAGLAACSADDTGPDIPQASASTASTSPSASPTPSVVDGVTLTAQGTQLQVGQTATVSYQPRQGQTAVFDLTVTRLEQTSFKKSFAGWDLSAKDKKATPFFVRVTITNRGALDPGGRPVPLYIIDGANTLIEATTFASTFKPCEPGRFPSPFPTGATTEACLVYLSPDHGALTAVSFRPVQEFAPITWTGPLEAPEKQKQGKKNKNKQQ